MKKIKLVKTSYTLPEGNRVVSAGEYNEDFFSSEEITYLKQIRSIRENATAKKTVTAAPKKVEKKEDKLVINTGKVEDKKNQESKE